MGAGMSESHSDLVPCCKYIVNGQLAVRHRCLQMLGQLDEPVGIVSKAGWHAARDKVGRHYLPHRALISGLKCLKSSLYNLFVVSGVCRHQGFLSLLWSATKYEPATP